MKKYIIVCLLCIAFCNLNTNAQTREIDSLENVLKKNLHDTTRVDVLRQLCWELIKKDTALAIDYGKQALKLALEKKFKRKVADIYFTIGILYSSQYKESKAMLYYKKYLKQNEAIGFKEGIANAYHQIAATYNNLAIYDKAMDNYLKSLRMYESIHNNGGMAKCYNNIGSIYFLQKNYEKAMEYMQKSLKLREYPKGDPLLGHAYNNIGKIYKAQNNYTKALEYCMKAASINIKQQQTYPYLVKNYFNIGQIYTDLNNYKLAEEYLNKALKFCDTLSNNKDDLYTNIYLSFGELYIKTGQYQEALNNFNQALTLSEKIKFLLWKKNAYFGIYKTYKKMNNAIKALEYHELYITAKDSLFTSEKSENLAQIEARYKFEQEVSEQKRIEQEAQKTAQLKKQRDNNIQYSIITICILFFVIILFFTGRFILKPRAIEIMVFFTILLLFEFILVVLDPQIDFLSKGTPVIKLGANALLALLIFPLHSLLEERLKLRIIKKKREMAKTNL